MPHKKNTSTRRTARLFVRVTPHERALLDGIAEATGLTVSAILRRGLRLAEDEYLKYVRRNGVRQ